MSARSRRRTAKVINYAKEQEFSDAEDLFEDEEEEAPQQKRRAKAKKKDVVEDDMLQEDQRPVYTEKGYDPTLPPLRERFPFLPEYEEDGSPKIDLIVGRRPIDEKEDNPEDSDVNDESETPKKPKAPTPPPPKSSKKRRGKKEEVPTKPGELVEYEYLIKYKGRSYLHLEWKTGADLESMNKSAKGIYRRFLKKLPDEELESPDFDQSYGVPEKIVDEADQEITVEMTDKEILKWEKEQEKNKSDEDIEKAEDKEKSKPDEKPKEEPKAEAVEEAEEIGEITWPDEIDFKTLDIELLRKIIKKEGPYYGTVNNSDNPYRDGYVTEPPKKPRVSYMFFQGCMRHYYSAKNPDMSQSELMALLGEVWRGMDDLDKEIFQILANDENKEYEHQRLLLEKAQKPNGVWQPLRRCREVLERLAADSFADIFLEPVDMDDFPDYDDIIDNPMDLGTVRQRLDDRKYQSPEQFARDMRRIWNNCKIYNQHGSAIWHVADYMSKQFERLYHAWVLEFRERYLRWADRRARPWEHSCREHDGKCGTPDDQMVLCDHCDAEYGMACVSPPLKKVPTKGWHCPDCKPKLNTAKGTRMLSAVAENAARKRAELGDLPKKKITRTMFLVKWLGLGYEYCTWETRDDVGNDRLISEFHKREKGFSDEADMPEEVIREFMSGVTHVNNQNAGGMGIIPELRSQLYAQNRGFEFLKFAQPIPKPVVDTMGPVIHAVAKDPLPERPDHPVEVIECVNELAYRVARTQRAKNVRGNTVLPPTLTGEYDAIIPITAKGLMMNVGEINGWVAFLGYRQFPDGSRGPAEIAGIIRNIGDKIIAVDGVSTVGKSFKSVINMLKESGKRQFAYMRFLENQYGVCEPDLVSVGPKGRYTLDALRSKFAADRRRVVTQRIADVIDDEEPEVPSDDDVSSKEGEEDGDSEAGSEGSFEPDSDEDELVGTVSAQEVSHELSINMQNGAPEPSPDAKPSAEGDSQSKPEASPDDDAATPEASKSTEEEEEQEPEGVRYREETTRSLAVRLLDVDLGYSSDEGGEEDNAYFLDGVDDTFGTKAAFEELDPNKKQQSKDKKAVVKEMIPASRTEFSALGEKAKLAAAAALSTKPPNEAEFEGFPEVRKREKEVEKPKTTKRSTVKVEQVNAQNGEVIHVWANVEAAAATLQLPLPAMKSMLTDEYDEDVGEDVGGFKWRYAMAGAKVTAGITDKSRGAGGKKAKEAWLEFRDKLYDPSEPHDYKNGNRLRDYQVDGVNWLASTWYKRQGCILADEMGLGKTVQIVCYIEHLFRVEKIHRPFLVVVPLSTVEHWRREFDGWTDMICCVYHDRQRVWRDVLREYEWYYEDRPHTAEFLKFDVLVTTYDTLIGDFDVISQVPFRVAVVDEAHRLRNQKGKLLECMREISARGTMQYGFQSRVLMSGTPLQNDLTELWTLLNFIEPFKFPDLAVFQHNFGNMANRGQVEALQQMISPFMLRRVKEDVAKDIPAKEETVIDVELTSIQKKYYRAIFEHNHAFLNMGSSRTQAPKLMNIQMELRKVCNHPFLLEGVEHRETDRLFREYLDKGAFKDKTPEEQQHMISESGYIMTSGKMVLLDKLLPKLRQEGHKILVFSQMVKMIDLISEYCEFRNFNYERLDGRVRGSERQKAIDRFEREPDSFLFLLSTRAGGVGINLTAADICIIFDSDWNPQNDVQAQARCHRIGQTKDVRIYRLVTSRSFEQEMFDRASKKLGLEQAVLGTFEKDTEDDKPTQKEMEQLLKRGAYALLEDENDEVTKQFCADDIESILAKRTRTRVVEGTKTASWLNKQGMVVSKSKFSAESGGGLDMDDPDFWQKVMPDYVTPSIMLQKMNDLENEIEGKVKGPGRGRWRKKREQEAALKKKLEEEKSEQEAKGEEDEPSDEDDVDSDGEKKKKKLSRGQVKKVQKFVNDLKGMMQNLFEEEDEDAINGDEKAACQKLLLTMSVKERLFNDEQRHMAKKFLKRFEGSRRRRCRTSESQEEKNDSKSTPQVREELMIRGTKRSKKKRKRSADDTEESAKKRKRSDEEAVDADGYLKHSDEEDDWSDVGGDIYQSGAKNLKITRKEAQRRRQWTADDDAATAAGRAWPVFPRELVSKVLETLLDKVTEYDQEKGGIFSVPVPKDEFPEYYEQIKKPMDYGTMRDKLEAGEYRSAQAMQKDFVLIMQNCRKFNDDKSDIVQEAREQHLMRPKFLQEAATTHDLFLAEDGSVLEVVDEKSPKKSKKKEEGSSDSKKKKKKSKKKKKDKDRSSKLDTIKEGSGDEGDKKPRIRINVKDKADSDAEDSKAAAKRKRDDDDEAPEDAPIPKKKRKAAPKKDEGAASDDDERSRKASGADESAIYLDLDIWKTSRSQLDGSFKAARKNLMQHGEWKLPSVLPSKSFAAVALTTLEKMNKHDSYNIFAEEVTEDDAPGYADVVKNPMDFGTMKEKVNNGDYGDGSKAAAAFYNDFKQVFDNCYLFNEEGTDVTEEASKVLGLLPEAYVAACIKESKNV